MEKKHMINDHKLNDNLTVVARLKMAREIGYEFGIEGIWYGLNALVLKENFNYSNDEIEAYSVGFSEGRKKYFKLIKNRIWTKILREQLLH